MRKLARQLLALEASDSRSQAHEAVIVSEKLRSSLTRFAGVDGFKALLRRALALARADVPSLEAVEIGADGRLEGFEKLLGGTTGIGSDPGAAVTEHLLGLMMTFVGESLTLRLVRDAWPGVSLDE